MKYLTTTIQPGLILAVEDREAMGLRADHIVVNEYPEVEGADGEMQAPKEYTTQQAEIKARDEAAAQAARDGVSPESITISREDGSVVGEPERYPGGDELTADEEVAPELVESAPETPQPDTATGGKPVRARSKTSAKDAE